MKTVAQMTEVNKSTKRRKKTERYRRERFLFLCRMAEASVVRKSSEYCNVFEKSV